MLSFSSCSLDRMSTPCWRKKVIANVEEESARVRHVRSVSFLFEGGKPCVDKSKKRK